MTGGGSDTGLGAATATACGGGGSSLWTDPTSATGLLASTVTSGGSTIGPGSITRSTLASSLLAALPARADLTVSTGSTF